MQLKLGRDVAPYETYQIVHILMLLWQHAQFQSPASSKLNGFFQKKSAPPRRMGSFFNPPSHLDFLKHKTPPPVWISKTKDPPPAWISGKKILGLNIIYLY